MKRVTACLMSIVLAVGLVPAPAFAQAGGLQAGFASGAGLVVQVAAAPAELAADAGAADADAQGTASIRADGTPNAESQPVSGAGPSGGAQGATDLEQVQAAFANADAYVADQGFRSPALKDAFERELPGALCYAIDAGTYYVLYRDAAYIRAAGTVSSADDGAIRAYDTLAAACAANAADDAFITRGLAVAGDKGHGYYVKADAALPHERVSAGAPDRYGKREGELAYSLDVRIGANGYRLTSAEDALGIFQIGYQVGDDVAPFIQAFENTSFRTLTLPQGEYRLGKGVWVWRDDTAVYGFDATLVAGDDFEATDLYNSLWYIRGEINWFYTADPYGWVCGHELNGVKFERRTSAGHALGCHYGTFVRNARDVTICNCEVADPNDSGLTCYEFYGNYSDVNLIGCAARAFGALEIRDLCNQDGQTFDSLGTGDVFRGGCHDIVVRDCDFTMWSHDEGMAIFAGNEQGLKNADGVEYPILKECLVENLTVEDSRFTFEEPRGEKHRVVAVTCGYQDSPVRNVAIRNNTFDVYAESYFMMFGYVEGATVEGNAVKAHSPKTGGLSHLFERADHSRTGPTENIVIKGNTFDCPDEGCTLTRVLDRALGEQVTFAENELSVSGKTTKLLDSPARYVGNTFHLGEVGSLYSNVRDVSDNTYTMGKLGSLFEGNSVNAAADIVIANEHAAIAEVPNHLMGFFGSGSYAPRFNGHALTFLQCDYDIANAPGRWRRIAYGSSDIADSVVLTFWDCSIPGFEAPPYNTVDKNESGKVKLRFMSGGVSQGLLLQGVEAYREGGGFDDITANVAFEPLGAAVVGADVGQLSGEVVGGFELSGDERLADADVTVAVTPATAASDDVIALYRRNGAVWELATYTEVVGGEFTYQTVGFGAGTYALVDKARDLGDPQDVALSSLEDKNNLRDAWKSGGIYQAQRDLSIGECWVDATAAIEETELCSTTVRGTAAGAGVNFKTDANTAPAHLYFRGCTFDAETFSIERPGVYVFDRCEFANSPRTSIAAAGAGVRIFVFNSTLHDNKPPLDEFNANANSVRSWSYTALSFRSDDASIHACRTTISGYQTNPTVLVTQGCTGNALYFEHCVMERCGGCGISMNSPVRGRIDNNRFADIGALRGEDGYAASSDSRWGWPAGVGAGRGVGGNAVYGSAMSYHMRVRANVITDVMENGIEGYYWCVDGNRIDGTGCRFDEGFDTVSTEAIWGASAFVRGNLITRPHGSGIVVNASHRPYDLPFDIVVSGNTVTKDSYGLMDDTDGIRVASGGLFEGSGHVVTVSGNTVKGFRRAHLTLGTHDNVTYEDNEEALPALSVDSIETQSGDGDFTQALGLVSQTREGLVGTDSFGAPTGASVAAFTLALENAKDAFDYAEVHVSCDGDLAKDGDVVALYRTDAGKWNWKCYGYYQVVGGGFTFELASSADLGTFDIVNKSQAGKTGFTDLSALEGTRQSDKLANAFKAGGAYKGVDASQIATARRYMNKDGQYAAQLEFRDLEIYCSDDENGGANNGFTFAREGGCNFYFENCTFDHLDFNLFVSGTYAFVNCAFVNYPRNAIAAQATGAKVFLYGCTFKDNAPDLAIWNQNIPGDRHAKYAAVRVRGDATGLHAAGCTFANLQTDSVIIVERKGDDSYADVEVCFERNEMTDCGGAGLVLDNRVRGRVDGNTFANIGATRGMNGYKSTIHPTLGEYDEDGQGAPGAGVGGNAVFARDCNTQMRVRGNTCTNLMENGIEGTYYCISDNRIDTTGYRYDDAAGDSYNGGYKTVSTEGIAAAGTWYVTGNTVRNVHGRGIGVSHWNNHPVIISGNTVVRRADGNRAYDTSEGIKVRTDAQSWANVTVRDNVLEGFENNYRVIHAEDADKTRMCENVVIEDANGGRVMGPVYSNLRGVKITTARDVALAVEAADEQVLQLPDSLCIVCLELKVKSSTGAVNVGVATSDSSYNSSVPLNRISGEEFTCAYACFKAIGATRVRLSAADAGQLEIAGVSGWYEVEPAALSYALSYDLAGGVGAGANPETYTSEESVVLDNPLREGFTFSGWTGTDVGAPAMQVVIPRGSIGARSFTATWEAVSGGTSGQAGSGAGQVAEEPVEAGGGSDGRALAGVAADAGAPASATTGSGAARIGKVAVKVRVSGGSAELVSAKSAKGTVRVNKVRTAGGRAVAVSSIAAGAFKGSKVTKVVIGKSVKKVGRYAFRNCKRLKTVVIGKGVTKIGKGAFKGCKNLKKVKLARGSTLRLPAQWRL